MAELSDGYTTNISFTPKISKNGTHNRLVFSATQLEYTPETSALIADMKAFLIAAMHNIRTESANSSQGYSSKQINDYSKLVSAMVMLSKEERESIKDQVYLQGLTQEEQIKAVLEALKILGVVKDGR